MKRFIRRCLVFVLPIVLGSYLVDVCISTNLRKTNFGEFSVWNDIINGDINSAIVIYGSSRAWVQISPSMITDSLGISAYNVGIDGHHFGLQYLRHSLLLQHNTKPTLIILSLDMFTLEKSKYLYNSGQFLPYMLFNEEIEKATISYEGFHEMDYEIPLIRYFGHRAETVLAISHMLGLRSSAVPRTRGYQGQNLLWNSDFERAKLEMDYYEVKLDTASVLLFEKFIDECKEKQIKLLFVYSPEYIEGQRFIKNRDEIITLYKTFGKKYGIPYYDYSADSISFQRKYFYNALHLNTVGAELFTHELISVIDSAMNGK